jgi:lysylphosphatidylglycerol synthetase-like protein (DUF2156 family)
MSFRSNQSTRKLAIVRREDNLFRIPENVGAEIDYRVPGDLAVGRGVRGDEEGAEVPATRSGWVTLVAVLYLISGVFNVLIGLVALGVTLSGSATVETAYVGDWPTDNLEGAAVAVIVLAVLQLILGAGILQRARWAWIAGLVIASLVIVTHVFYYRLLDGWAVGGLFTNILIVWILVVKAEEFSTESPA